MVVRNWKKCQILVKIVSYELLGSLITNLESDFRKFKMADRI